MHIFIMHLESHPCDSGSKQTKKKICNQRKLLIQAYRAALDQFNDMHIAWVTCIWAAENHLDWGLQTVTMKLL